MQQELIKKTLQKIVNQSIKDHQFKNVVLCEIYFVFNSKNPKGNCELLYGMRIWLNGEPIKSILIDKLKLQIKKNAEKVISSTICCESVLINKL